MNSSVATTTSILKYPWMFGRAHDLFFFFFSALIGLGIYILTQSSIVATSVIFAALIPTAFGAGPFHQGPTWFMYFDKKNREHYGSSLKKKLIFFFAPPTILILSVLGMIFCRPLILGIWFVWSIQHLVQQNVGILLLYHNPRANEVVVTRKTETLSLQVSAAFFSLLFIRRVIQHGNGSVLFDALIGLLAVWTIALFLAYAADFYKQVQEGKSINVPALVFWAMSALCLLPFACMGSDFSEAFVAPVTWHWFQYIGLNWRLVTRKYNGGSNNASLPVSRPILLFVSTCLTLVLINVSLSITTHHPGVNDITKTVLLGVLIGIVHIHYFLDAFMWRFREPYQREAILPYLTERNHQAARL